MAKQTKLLPDSLSAGLKNIAIRTAGTIVFAFGAALIAALIFYNPYMDGVSAASNYGVQGLFGNIVAGLRLSIGWVPSLFILLCIVRAGLFLMARWTPEVAPEIGTLKLFLSVCFGAAGFGAIMPSASYGGILGTIVAHDLNGLIGGWTVAFGILFILIFLIMAGSLLQIKLAHVKLLFGFILKTFRLLGSALHLVKYEEPEEDEEEYEEEDTEEEYEEEEQPKRKSTRKSAASKAAQPRKNTKRAVQSEYSLPPPEFLEKSVFSKHTVTNELKRNASAMEANFETFGVYGKIAGIKPGPIVTLYEFEPEAGMRIAKIADTVKDMTRAMAAENIRIAHIPRSNYIGVEMVNMDRQTVRFQSLVTNDAFVHSKYHLPLALGVDIGGNPIYFDLAKMPHVLIAGRTGSGKSVFVQSIIMSILYHFTADECKLVIIDPKGVDFTLWHDIPHLITPIVTDANQAVNALKWTVREMEERYKKLKEIGVQNIEGYNEAMEKIRTSGKKITHQVAVGTDPETGELEFEEQEWDTTDMPYLVVIIDEVADLMSVARKEVEACVQRLAQKARAAGIHLVMATQRPDTSVITGVIKANFPTRISFQARSNIDSMTTLGEKGAEQLLAFGDMLFSEAGKVPVRIHGAWIENKEINKVADFLRAEGEPQYVDGIGEGEDLGGASSIIPGLKPGKEEKDGDQYRQAIEYVVRDRKPTISYVQRRLGVGYNKAAGFIERMEAEGIISPPDGNNKRHVL